MAKEGSVAPKKPINDMTRYCSLFERLAGTTYSLDGRSPQDCIAASVASHLGKMLNARAGSVQALLDHEPG
ncbi:hypothetical protein OOJ96_23700 [Pseudomonas sp. 15FMM2]|uniref:Uncharacterized protein n=1 Tax=Pseudomonas imrae TaxID=2992837 RepID=A0ACC7PLG2_9PSED